MWVGGCEFMYGGVRVRVRLFVCVSMAAEEEPFTEEVDEVWPHPCTGAVEETASGITNENACVMSHI